MKTNTQIIWSAALILTLMLAACSEKSNPTKDEMDPEPTPQTQLSKLELISKHWDIDTAYHDGDFDLSSTGKDIVFYSNGTYTFDGSLNGDWYFTPDSLRVLIDQGTSFAQDWTLTDLDENRFVADFRSPFTNKKSQWIMSARP